MDQRSRQHLTGLPHGYPKGTTSREVEAKRLVRIKKKSEENMKTSRQKHISLPTWLSVTGEIIFNEVPGPVSIVFSCANSCYCLFDELTQQGTSERKVKT